MFMTSVGGKSMAKMTESERERENLFLYFFTTMIIIMKMQRLLMRYSSVWLRARSCTFAHAHE